MAARETKPSTYVERLLIELEEIHAEYGRVLAASTIENIDPNRGDPSGGFVGFPEWGWAPSDAVLEDARLALLGRVRDWEPRFRLVFPQPTPTVKQWLDEHIGRLERWLVREGVEHDVPPTVEQAIAMIDADLADLRVLTELLPADEYAIRLVVDTYTLVDNPDIATHVSTLGRRYMVHLLPVVLAELDDLKRSGRTPDLREAAQRAERRLKELRAKGDVRRGVRVAGDVYVVFEHVEPAHERLPAWLDLTVADDRFVASSLLLQAQHPGSALYVATSDINLQTKLSAVGLPFVEPPET